MSLDRLISRELRRNPPDVEERVRAMKAGLFPFDLEWEQMQPLGREFSAVWDENIHDLYES